MVIWTREVSSIGGTSPKTSTRSPRNSYSRTAYVYISRNRKAWFLDTQFDGKSLVNLKLYCAVIYGS